MPLCIREKRSKVLVSNYECRSVYRKLSHCIASQLSQVNYRKSIIASPEIEKYKKKVKYARLFLSTPFNISICSHSFGSENPETNAHFFARVIRYSCINIRVAFETHHFVVSISTKLRITPFNNNPLDHHGETRHSCNRINAIKSFCNFGNDCKYCVVPRIPSRLCIPLINFTSAITLVRAPELLVCFGFMYRLLNILDWYYRTISKSNRNFSPPILDERVARTGQGFNPSEDGRGLISNSLKTGEAAGSLTPIWINHSNPTLRAIVLEIIRH